MPGVDTWQLRHQNWPASLNSGKKADSSLAHEKLRRSERTLTFRPVRSCLKRGPPSVISGENPADVQCRLVGPGGVSQAMKTSWCVHSHVGGTLCGLFV